MHIRDRSLRHGKQVNENDFKALDEYSYSRDLLILGYLYDSINDIQSLVSTHKKPTLKMLRCFFIIIRNPVRYLYYKSIKTLDFIHV